MAQVELLRHSAERGKELRAACRLADASKKQLEELLEVEKAKVQQMVAANRTVVCSMSSMSSMNGSEAS